MGAPIPLYEPLESGVNDNIFISKSYDATSHFETTTGKFIFCCKLNRKTLTERFRRCQGYLQAGRR